MADPTAYTISYSFTDYQTASPSDPLPAAKIDIEYANISTSLASLRTSLMDVRRSDGALTNGIVTKDSLAADLKIALVAASDLLVPTVSTTGLTYVYGDLAGVLSKHEPLGLITTELTALVGATAGADFVYGEKDGVVIKHEPMALMTTELVAAPVATTGAAYVYAESAAGAVVKHEPGALITNELTATAAAATTVSYLYGETAGGAIVRLGARFTPDVSSTTRFGMKDAGGIFIHEAPTAVPTIKIGATLRTQLDPTYTGGTIGNVLSSHWNSATVGAGVADFVWAGLDILNNSATAGENVARYAQATKSSTGPTWAGVFQAQDDTEVANPTSGLYGLEVDIGGNGTDSSNTRRGIDIIGYRKNNAGADVQIAYGIIIQPMTEDIGHVTFLRGISLKDSMTTGIEIECDGTYGIKFAAGASQTIGIDLSEATLSTAAIRIAADQKIAWNATGVYTSYFKTATSKIVFETSGVEKFAINVGGQGQIAVSGNQVVGVRETGWAAMTGTANKNTAYATSTVTLAELAGRVMSIQSALTTHGLIGA